MSGSAEEDFEAFVHARGPALWRRAWLLTADYQHAEDLLQTALARSWPKFERIQGAGSFEAYVQRVMVNVYLTKQRRHWRKEIPTALVPEPSGTTVPDVAVTLTRLDLLAALVSLTPKQRTVILLRYFDDMTEAQVAERLGCSVATIKTHHSRAISRLRAGEKPVRPNEEISHDI